MDRFTSISDVNEGSSSTAGNYSRADTPPPDILDEENVVLAKRRGGQLLTTDGPLLLKKVPHPPVNCGEDDDDDNNREYDYNADDITKLQEETNVKQEVPVSAATSDVNVKEEASETRSQNTGLGLLAEPISVTVPKTGIDRFSALLNMVKNNLKWANALGSSQDDDANEVHQVEGEEMLTFNVEAFKANVQAVNPLTPEIKMILCTHSWNRSTSNIKTVFKFLNKLTFFDKYSHTIKMELASMLYYETFEEGRVLVKQGHPGRSFYYILSGSVIIENTEEDARTGEKKMQVVGETPAGSAFGELALHETKRTATIVCKGDSEFLRVDKPDFDMVLRRSYQQEWDNRMTALKSLTTFEDWTEEELQSTIDRCTFEEYPPNTVILSDPEQTPDHVYFIKSGECKVVRDVTLIKSNLPFGHVKLSLPPYTSEMEVEPEFLSKYQGNLHNATLHICTFGKGRFFSVGEDLRKTHIISIGKVECILVARVAFLFHNHGRCIEPMKQSVEEMIPSREDAFNSYIEGIKWRNYKRGLVKELVNRRHIPNNTTMADVPLVLRRETQR